MTDSATNPADIDTTTLMDVDKFIFLTLSQGSTGTETDAEMARMVVAGLQFRGAYIAYYMVHGGDEFPRMLTVPHWTYVLGLWTEMHDEYNAGYSPAPTATVDPNATTH